MERWVQWREGRLLSAGFTPALAEVLAHQDRIDLHELLTLVDCGCPPHLAPRILTPLDAPLDALAPLTAMDEPDGW